MSFKILQQRVESVKLVRVLVQCSIVAVNNSYRLLAPVGIRSLFIVMLQVFQYDLNEHSSLVEHIKQCKVSLCGDVLKRSPS